MASTLERVPMGASDLKANAQRMFRKALIISCVVHLAIIGAYMAAKLYHPPDEAAYTGRVIRMETLPPPPPLTDAPPPPVITAPKIAPPTMGTPVPVPDAQAPEQTIMTQQELSAALTPVGYGASGKDSLVIKGDDLPSEGEFVYYEDAPAPVTQVQPVYPEMAREAQVSGRVVLHVLVGKDGRVKNVKVIRSVTMLDQAAVEAVKKWVFKPALSNNKPVAVWVEVPVDFHF
jgi:periplasmic protein TonB